MRYLSVCSGIEAASIAWAPLGWTPEAFAEIEAFPSAVLAYRWPDVPNLGDFTEIVPQPGHDIRLLVGGTPCQGFSIAGLRGSLSDDRSNLCLQFVRLAHALRATGPLQYVVWENVPGVLSTDDNAFGCFLGGLSGADDAVLPSAKPPARKSTDLWAWKRDKDTDREFHVAKWPDAGMVAGPRSRIAWRILDAQHHGLAQRRRRVFVVAGFGEDTDPAAVLFEPRRMQRHSPEGRKPRQGVTGTLNARASAGGGLGTDFECGGGIVAHRLRAEGFDASEDGTGRGTPIIPVAFGGNNTSGPINVAAALTAKGGVGRMDFESETLIAAPLTAPAMRTGGGGADKPHALTGFGVRRLTPTECERLQGFSDGHTLIPMSRTVRKQIEADMAAYLRGQRPDITDEEICHLAADGPRYRALGNSMAVPCMRWIGQRIQQSLEKAGKK